MSLAAKCRALLVRWRTRKLPPLRPHGPPTAPQFAAEGFWWHLKRDRRAMHQHTANLHRICNPGAFRALKESA